MTSQLRRSVTSVVVAALSAALGAGGVYLAAQDRAARPPATTTATPRLHVQAVYNSLHPAIVDVTAQLRYDGVTAEGTGFVISAAGGLVLTNNHVIRDATTVTVTLTSDGRRVPARIVGTDVSADIAVLQVPAVPGLAQASLGTAAVPAGTPVVAIGNQAGAGGNPTVAPGVITAVGQTIQADDASSEFTETLRDMLQTSATIAPGDSGGPLADARGQVIGVVTAAGSGSGAPAGYAIPIADALAAARLITAGRPAPGVVTGARGFLGVVVPHGKPPAPAQTTVPSVPSHTSAPEPHCVATSMGTGSPRAVAPDRFGVVVYAVLCGTGAAAAGLAAGDVITALDGQPVTSADALAAIMSRCRPGSLVPVTWVSPSGRRQTRLVRLDAAPAA